MNETIKKFEALKQKFLSGINQALKVPVEKSIESVDKIVGLGLNKEQETHIGVLKENLAAIKERIDSVMQLSAASTGAYKYNNQEFSLTQLLESVIEPFISPAFEKKINLYIYIDPNLPKTIISDKEVISHILKNLISNAVRFTSASGSVYADIRSKHLGDDQASITFSITDTGPGIDKGRLREVMQPFGTISESSLGTGLSSCFYLLKGMDSQLKIASEEAKGSRFSFVLNAQTAFIPSHDLLPDLKIGVLIDERELFGYAKLLYQYFISMGLSVVSIGSKSDEHIAECQALFLVTGGDIRKKIAEIQTRYPYVITIPAVVEDHISEEEKSEDRIHLTLPAMPSKLISILDYIKHKIPDELSIANAHDQKVIEEIALKEEQSNEPIRILVVEDNPINMKLVKVILARYSFIVEGAENGEIAVEKSKQERFDLILMDIDMPVMDGITATKNIKEYEQAEGIPETPIVALTSHDLVGERSEILSSGLDEHMPKPLNVARLELMLERFVGYKHSV